MLGNFLERVEHLWQRMTLKEPPPYIMPLHGEESGPHPCFACVLGQLYVLDGGEDLFTTLPSSCSSVSSSSFSSPLGNFRQRLPFMSSRTTPNPQPASPNMSQPVKGSLAETHADGEPASPVEDVSSDLTKVRAHVSGLLRFTYRRGFSPISTTTITSDTHWGCMLRTGQMLLANALKALWDVHSPSGDGDATTSPSSSLTCPSSGSYTFIHTSVTPPYGRAGVPADMWRVAQLFCDIPEAPFSVHCLATQGMAYGTPVGKWFSPTVTALVLRDLAQTCSVTAPVLRVLVADSGYLFLGDLLRPTASTPW